MSKLRKNPNKNVIKAVNKFQPWDYGFLLDIEREALINMRNYIRDYGCHINHLRDAQRIDIIIKMMDIIKNPSDIWNFPDEDSVFKYVNIKNAKRFWEYSCLNPKSASFKCELRERKAWHIYHKMREYWLQTFWD